MDVIPVTCKTVEEAVPVSEAVERVETVPAIYETLSERVMAKPAEN